MFGWLRSLTSAKLKDTGLHPLVLLIMDGWGLAPASEGNPISQAKTPVMDGLKQEYPNTELIASGESVGLPAGEVGNTEVGHLNLGAGRVILQELKRINLSVEKGTFFDNQAFLNVTKHVQDSNSKLHIIGLISTGKVHSNLDHFYQLIKLCKKAGLTQVYCHLFTDGRDAPPKQGVEVIGQVENFLQGERLGKIATVMGRYYGMDRDRRWERTQRAYEAIVEGKGAMAESAVAAIQAAYGEAKTDEFIEPTVITTSNVGTGRPAELAGKPLATIDDNDGLIFFNYRIDRPRQLTMALVADDFKKVASIHGFDPYQVLFEHTHGEEKTTVEFKDPFVRNKVCKNLFSVTMTEYQKGLPVTAVAFGPEPVEQCLAQVLSEKGIKQMHMAESEKERFVTYYFDGLREERFKDEAVLIVPSPKVPTYDRKPEMSVFELVEKFKVELSKGVNGFFVMNIANPDMVAHSGNALATVKALEEADRALGILVEAILAVNGTLLVTADHGNAEELLTYDTTSFFFTTQRGEINTDHSDNPVPLILVGQQYGGKKVVLTRGTLSDVAPTILKVMGIEVPKEMTGKILLQ